MIAPVMSSASCLGFGGTNTYIITSNGAVGTIGTKSGMNKLTTHDTAKELDWDTPSNLCNMGYYAFNNQISTLTQRNNVKITFTENMVFSGISTAQGDLYCSNPDDAAFLKDNPAASYRRILVSPTRGVPSKTFTVSLDAWCWERESIADTRFYRPAGSSVPDYIGESNAIPGFDSLKNNWFTLLFSPENKIVSIFDKTKLRFEYAPSGDVFQVKKSAGPLYATAFYWAIYSVKKVSGL